MTFEPANSQGFFLDPVLIIPDDQTDLRYRAKDLYEQVADAVNTRDISIYALAQVETGQQWFIPNNPQQYYDGWRVVVQMPDLPAGMSSTANHGITGLLKFTRIWAQGQDSSKNFYQIPYADPAGTGNIGIAADPTAVTITGGVTAPALKQVYAVLEYIKGAENG